MKLPTLYSKDSQGEIRMWEIHTEVDSEFYYAVSIYGLIRGAKQQSKKVCLAGGVPTYKIPEVESFCKSLWNKQKGKGYVETSDGEPQGIAPLPMLAHLFDKYKHKLIYPVIVQPKLDGFRCICIKQRGVVSCWSRSGKRFETTSLIEQELDHYMVEGDCYDGELYRHNEDFNKLSGSIRNVAENSSIAQYHIYDYISADMPQYQRFTKVKNLFKSDIPNIQKFQYIIEVPSFGAGSEEGVLGATTDFINAGYEGAIVRSLNNLYRPKYRSPEILKVKEFMDEDFKIVDFYEGEGKDEGAVIWECTTPKGEIFTVRPKGTYGERQKLFQEGELHKGKYLTVRYFPKPHTDYPDFIRLFKHGEEGKPRFPVGLKIKEEME